MAQTIKNLPVMQETQVRSRCQKDPLAKRMATHSGVLAWRTPWTEEPGGLQRKSIGSQRVGYDREMTTFDYRHPCSPSVPPTHRLRSVQGEE